MNIIFKPECKTEIIKPTYDLPIIGEPISKTGASANNSNAYGVIVGIIGDGSSRRVRVMTEGYIDYDKVKENYMEYTAEAINALTGITLCSGGKLPTGVQSDWNQNDTTKQDYVKNRPFYNQTETVTVENNGGNILYYFPVFAVGDTVTVNVDGVEHSLVAYDDNGSVTIGDTTNSIDSGEGQLGWQIYVDPIENEVWFYATETHTVSYLGVVYHKIDSKYLPDNPLNIPRANVGQIAKITKVDDKLKPTAWEAVDMPNAIANGDKEIILTSSTANSTKKFKITVDDSGTLTATEVTV